MNHIQSIINEELDDRAPYTIFKGHEIIDIDVVNTVGMKCSTCGSEKINVHERQTRSADEAATQFFKCLTCGKKWKKN